jgi:hypothetical protein
VNINRDNVKWAARLMSIIVLVAVAEVLVVTFMPRPFPWVAIIPASTPLLIALFLILPMKSAEKT